jgi:hypothetical protein
VRAVVAICVAGLLACCGGSAFTTGAAEGGAGDAGDAQELDAPQGAQKLEGAPGPLEGSSSSETSSQDAPGSIFEGGDATAGPPSDAADAGPLEAGPEGGRLDASADVGHVDDAGHVDAPPACVAAACPVPATCATRTACCTSAGVCGCLTPSLACL